MYTCQIAVLYVKHGVLVGKEGEDVAGGGFCVQHINGHIDNPQNLNGTFHNGVKISHPKNEVRVPVLLENGDILRIDNSDLNNTCDNGVLLLFTTGAIQGKWGSNVIFLGDCLLYGRSVKETHCI